MTQRTIIDPSQPWTMRVSTPGKDVVSGGGPYLFDGSLEPLRVHQSGIVPDIFQWFDFNTAFVCRAIGTAGRVVSFPSLPYVPHIEWGITSDAFGGAIDFPGCHMNNVTGSYTTELVSLPVAMIPSTSSFKIIATTRFAAQNYSLGHGGAARQGDLYYTVFKRATT